MDFPRKKKSGISSLVAIIAVVVVAIIVIGGVAAVYLSRPNTTAVSTVTATESGTTATVVSGTTATVVSGTTATVVSGTTATVVSGTTATTTATVTSTSSSTSSIASAPSNKTTLVVGTTYVIDTLDNGWATGFADAEIDHQINPQLVQFAYGTQNIVPYAALNWTISNGGTTYTFSLVPNEKFNNGDPLNASTWAYSLNRNFKLGASFFWMRPYVKNFTASGTNTLVINLVKPYAAFLSVLATGQDYEPLDSAQVTSTTSIGSGLIYSAGPYYATNYQPNVELDLKANPYFFGPKAATPNIRILFFSSSSSLVLAAQSKEVDAVFGQLSPEEVSIVSSAPGYSLTQAASPIPWMVGMNQLDSPLGNLSARQALALLTNRTQIVNTVYNGQASALYSIVPAGVLGANTAFKDIYGANPNLAQAQSLLTSLGYSKSHQMQVTLWYVSGDSTEAQTAAVLSQEWQSSGMIQVSLRTTDVSTLASYTVVNSTTVQTWLTDIVPPWSDPDVFLAFFVSSQYRSVTYGGTNFMNATVNSLINQERATTNSTLRASLAGQVQTMVAQQVPLLPYVQLNEQVEALSTVKGIILGGTTLFYYYLLYEPS